MVTYKAKTTPPVPLTTVDITHNCSTQHIVHLNQVQDFQILCATSQKDTPALP